MDFTPPLVLNDEGHRLPVCLYRPCSQTAQGLNLASIHGHKAITTAFGYPTYTLTMDPRTPATNSQQDKSRTRAGRHFKIRCGQLYFTGESERERHLE